MQIDRYVQRFSGFEHRPEERVVEVAAVDVAVDQRTDEAVLAHRPLQFGYRSVGVAHRQGGKPEKTVGVLGGRGDHGVVGLPGQLDGLRYLDGLDAGDVGQDLHVDTGRIHRGDSPLPQVFNAWRGPTASAPAHVEQFARAVGVSVRDSRERVVLLEGNDLHQPTLTERI